MQRSGRFAAAKAMHPAGRTGGVQSEKKEEKEEDHSSKWYTLNTLIVANRAKGSLNKL